MFGAAFKVLGFLSFVEPERCWEKATHWLMGIFKVFGNFSIQFSASASDFGLSPLKITITPWASFWIPGQILSFLILPISLKMYLTHPRIRLRRLYCRLMFNAQQCERYLWVDRVNQEHCFFVRGSLQLLFFRWLRVQWLKFWVLLGYT